MGVHSIVPIKYEWGHMHIDVVFKERPKFIITFLITFLALALVKMNDEFFEHFWPKMCLIIIGQCVLGGVGGQRNIAPLLHLNLDIGVIDYTRGGAGLGRASRERTFELGVVVSCGKYAGRLGRY